MNGIRADAPVDRFRPRQFRGFQRVAQASLAHAYAELKQQELVVGQSPAGFADLGLGLALVDARVVHAMQHAVGVGERRQRAFAPEGLGEMVLEQVNDPGKRRSDGLLDLLRGQVLARRIDRTEPTLRRFGLVVLGKLPPGVDHLDQWSAALEFPVHAQARRA
ncbi:MAG: hypothetical protein ACFHWZ_11205 [Phycisphaerales bacterium]